MRYIIYTRVSTNKQTVENQLHSCREYVYKLKDDGDKIIEFSEPDKSTMLPMKRRRKLIEMMDSLHAGDTLVVYKVDRLARDPQELINIYCNIVDKGINVRGVADPHLDKGSICIYAFIAYQERKNIQERTRNGLERKRANGEMVGGLRYGYRLDETKLQEYRDNVHSYGKPYLLLEEEREQEQVKIMVEMSREGASYGEIAQALRDRGYVNRKGKPVHKSTVFRVLRRLAPKTEALA